jgi:hypothetical protein
MINPEMICSVTEVPGGWQVSQCGLAVGDRVYPTREEASDRARYLNAVEEQYFAVLGRVAQIVDGLCRRHGVRRVDAQNLVQRTLSDIRESPDGDLAAFASGRSMVEAR